MCAQMIRRRALRHIPCEELLESRLCLSTMAFSQVDVECCADRDAAVAEIVDIDGDRDPDIIVTGRNVAWYENTDALGTFDQRHVIASIEPSLWYWPSVVAADFDADGDVDLLTGGPKIVSYFNSDGRGTFSVGHDVYSGESLNYDVLEAVDLDVDGDLDLIVSPTGSAGGVAWIENLDGRGHFGEPSEIISDSHHFLQAVDADADGDFDLLTHQGATGRLTLHENVTGETIFAPQVLLTETTELVSAQLVDIDQDDDLDLLTGHGGIGFAGDDASLQVWRNTSGLGALEPALELGNGRVGISRVYVLDWNRDGLLDIVSGSTYSPHFEGVSLLVTVILNQGENQGFAPPQTVWEFETEWFSDLFKVSDLNGDDAFDLVLSFSLGFGVDYPVWVEPMDGPFAALPHRLGTAAADLEQAVVADLDGDGDEDIVTANPGFLSSAILWYELQAGNRFGPQQVVAEIPVRLLAAADFDADGDVDIVGATSEEILFYENLDGAGNFGDAVAIVADARSISSLRTGDLNGDGQTDLLVSDHQSIAWFYFDGELQRWRRRTIGNPGRERKYESIPADLDGDGDLDVITGTSLQFVWYENLQGEGRFGPARAIIDGEVGASFVEAADLDGDGDLDLIAGLRSQPDGWLENQDGQGTFGRPRALLSNPPTRATPVDLDNDGDVDLVGQTYSGPVYFERVSNDVQFEAPVAISRRASATSSLVVSDLNRDGLVDIVSVSEAKGRLSWHEGRIVGDVNRDFRFDSGDLVAVFRVGKYEDKLPGNASFDEGDWDQDGDFGTSDLVYAFQAGNYVARARPTPGEIAAAIDWLFNCDNEDAPKWKR